MPSKVILSNNSALSSKYKTGDATVKTAIQNWIARDAAKGISAQYVALDDTADMSALGLNPVAHWNDLPGVKRAIDEIYNKLNPDYMVLFGAPDIIPHQDLSNPVRSDPDSSVPSDLPYACSAGYSNNIEDFIGATRVITRLPDIKGDADPENAAKLISSVTSAQPQSGIFYRNYFGVSAEVWSISTRLSLINVFGNASMQQDVPSAGSPWPVSELSRPSHFFNCHGAPADPKWYGQSKINPDDYPVANETRSMLGEISPATVVAAECCYGAQLYDPSLAGGQLPLCNAYLQSGACAFWGSSTIAYGPAASNDNADLICQYFFKELLNGASIGRAALIARQTYARKTLTLSPVDLKTLAQFLIYGDSSTVCVVAKTVGELSMKAVGTEARALESEIKQRRAHLLVDGEQLQRSRAITLLPIQTEDRVLEKIRALARDFGISEPQVQSLRVQRAMGAGVGAGPFDLTIEKAFEATGISEFHILADIRPGSEKQSFKLLEVAASNEDIIFVRELFSR